jgi:septal ring factor EnvC (AmiA/AmiB activator)
MSCHSEPTPPIRHGQARRYVHALLLASFLMGCGRPAQMGSSEEVLSAVDALYTAIASRRLELLDKSTARLEELHASKELPDAAYRQLKAYSNEAREGHWDPAIRKLHEFIRGQRRS